MKTKLFRRGTILVSVLVLAVVSVTHIPFVNADPPLSAAPSQSNCELGGSTSVRWDTLNHGDPVERPVITSLTVQADDESPVEEIDDPADPDLGTIGAAICPNVALGRRTGLFVYANTADGGDFDLTQAETPDSEEPITADSLITITIAAGDMNELAPYFSFALVHGYVTEWETSGLGTSNAALSVTMKPVRTPFGNTSGPNDFDFCTATPPNCNAVKSDADVLTASLDMTFTTSGDEDTVNEDYDVNGNYSEMRGSYFAMTGAMGGWAEAVGPGGQPRSIRATVGGPHFLANGSTQNIGSLQAFIPNNVVEDLFETTSEDLTADDLDVIKVEEGEDDTTASFDLSVVSDGIIVSINNFHFSSPAFNIGLAGFVDTGGEGGGGEDGGDPNNPMIEGSGEASLVALQTADGTVINSFSKSAESGLAVQDAGYDYPFGLQSFTFEVPEGSTQVVQLVFMTDRSPAGLIPRKLSADGTYANITDYELKEDTIEGHHVLVLNYEIEDGGDLDQDGDINGSITDPVGLGYATVGAPNTGLRR